MDDLDKAGESYWDKNWLDAAVPPRLDPEDLSLDNYVTLHLHRYFEKFLKGRRNFSVLEVGCANSVWPIYFYEHYSAWVAGLDYSPVGCRMTEKLFTHYHVPAKVLCCDLFDPPSDVLHKFDLLVSFGVVEHFSDTVATLKACAKYLKPGGFLFTLIPNMPGVVGHLQKWIDKKVYDVHQLIDKKSLIDANISADLELLDCDYFLAFNFSVVNSGEFSTHPANKYLRHIFSGTSKLFWLLEKVGVKVPVNKVTSPYILSLARVKDSHEDKPQYT